MCGHGAVRRTGVDRRAAGWRIADQRRRPSPSRIIRRHGAIARVYDIGDALFPVAPLRLVGGECGAGKITLHRDPAGARTAQAPLRPAVEAFLRKRNPFKRRRAQAN
ncbi:MAG: hypothetical protein IPL88_12530 [Rhizobiales bacterium]|nr:hypothetical protein [Hyphomicrobiales bacterium]